MSECEKCKEGCGHGYFNDLVYCSSCFVALESHNTLLEKQLEETNIRINFSDRKREELEKKVEKLREALETIASDEIDKLLEYKKKHHLQSRLFVMDDVSDIAKAALEDGE